MTRMNPVHHPIHSASPSSGPIPTSYVVYRRAQHCTNCGTLHEYVELYAKTHLRSSAGGKYITNLRPLDQPEYNLPIEIMPGSTRKVPFCHECADRLSLSNLPAPPDNVRIVASHQNPNFFDKQKPATNATAKPTKSTAEILDLI